MNIGTIDKPMDQDIFWSLQFAYIWQNEAGSRFSYNLHLAVSKCKRIIVFNTRKKSPLSKDIYPHRLKHIFLLMA